MISEKRPLALTFQKLQSVCFRDTGNLAPRKRFLQPRHLRPRHQNQFNSISFSAFILHFDFCILTFAFGVLVVAFWDLS
jgi:hypothetical protein